MSSFGALVRVGVVGALTVVGSVVATSGVGAASESSPVLDIAIPSSTVAVALTDVTASGMELRFRQAEEWSEWTLIEVAVNEAPDSFPQDGVQGAAGRETGGTAGGESRRQASFGPIWFGQGADRLEIRLGEAPAGTDGAATIAITVPNVHFISARDIGGEALPNADDSVLTTRNGGRPGPTAGFSAGSPSASAFMPGVQLLTAPAIRQRSAWTARSWAEGIDGCGSGPSSASSLKAAVVHHTVTGNGYSADEVDDVLRAIHFTHTEINGWCDIGYNFLVDRFGTIWEGRTGSLRGQVIGGHTRGFNTTTVGIALLGQHQRGLTSAGSGVEPTTAARAAVQRVAAWKLASNGVDPIGRTWLRNRSDVEPLRLSGPEWHYVPTILGHRDLGVTSCPGDLAYGHVHAMGAAIQGSQASDQIFSRPAWVAAEHGPAVVTVTAGGGVLASGASPASWTGQGLIDDTDSQVVAVAGTAFGGLRLWSDGSLDSFGSLAAPALPVDWPPPAVDVVDVALPEGPGAWVLTSDGRIHSVGEAPPLAPSAAASVVSPSAGDGVAVAMSLDPSGNGYIITRSGRLFPVGQARPVPLIAQPDGPVVDVAVSRLRYATPSGSAVASASGTADRIWILGHDGMVHVVGPDGSGPSLHFAEYLSGPRADALDIGSFDVSILEGRALVASSEDDGAWVVDQFGQLWPVGSTRLLTPVSTRTESGDVVDVALTALVADDEFLSSDDALYVDALYRLFAGRQPSTAEVSRTIHNLEIGVGRRALTEPLLVGQGWAGSRVDDVFQRVLGREPVGSGRQYWLGRLFAGMSFEQLGVMFYGSPEYYRSAGENEEYVRLLYQALLGRSPAERGLDYWTSQLENGRLLPAGVARQFYRSLESRRDRTARLYREVLGREPSSQELADGSRLLLDRDDGELAVDLAVRAEFYRNAADE